jgi:hypothetical protein
LVESELEGFSDPGKPRERTGLRTKTVLPPILFLPKGEVYLDVSLDPSEDQTEIVIERGYTQSTDQRMAIVIGLNCIASLGTFAVTVSFFDGFFGVLLAPFTVMAVMIAWGLSQAVKLENELEQALGGMRDSVNSTEQDGQ